MLCRERILPADVYIIGIRQQLLADGFGRERLQQQLEIMFLAINKFDIYSIFIL